MTRPLANPVVTNLLAIADDLALCRGAANLKQAAIRRAVSNAYYAVFHAICGICADSLIGRSKPDLARAIYRSIDHGPVKRHLLGAAAREIAPDVGRIGDLFASLQQQRHAADYEPAGPVFDLTQTLGDQRGPGGNRVDPATRCRGPGQACDPSRRQQAAGLTAGTLPLATAAWRAYVQAHSK